MGDSVLDNFYWLVNHKNHLRVIIDEMLRPSHCCVNLAVDQMTTFDFVKRDPSRNSWGGYESARSYMFADSKEPSDKTYKHLVAEDGCIHSIENLKKLENVTHVVVSIGGNDVYLTPSVQIALAKSLVPTQSHIREKIGAEFGQRVEAIVDQIAKAAPNALIVPVIVYHPHNQFPIFGTGGLTMFLQKSVMFLFLHFLAYCHLHFAMILLNHV
jgi:hypothetical protein